MEVAAGPGHPAATAPPFSAVAPSTLFSAIELAGAPQLQQDLSPSTRQPAQQHVPSQQIFQTVISAPQQVAPTAAQAVTWCTYPPGLAGNGIVSPVSVPSALFCGLLAQCAMPVQQQPCNLPLLYNFDVPISWDSSASAYMAAVQPAVAQPPLQPQPPPPRPPPQQHQEFQLPACEEAAAGQPMYELEIVVVRDDPPAVSLLQRQQQQWLHFQQFVCEEAAAAPVSFPPTLSLESQVSADLAAVPLAVVSLAAAVYGGAVGSSSSSCAAAPCVPGPAAYSIDTDAVVWPVKPSSRLSVWSGPISIGIGWDNSSGSLELAFADSFVDGSSSSFGGDGGSFWQLWDVGALVIRAAASRVPAGIG